ncbi:ribosomal protein S2, flavodoxin-like domain-containing protein [Lasiosphaeria ovina]|uniref:Ribosomal protein S2, flavodoxin-like domain-containing protein n=1 Tax=Lasiosphaeria ovina TaxID=92902 RepID=A0AAE0KIX5_9PEZI|nr:ribosomal protein S2, flavodoxin-like domain-containing protein [Lasiosphaeria ovina]
MIIRNLAIRHGRRALASPVSRPWLRLFSTQPTDMATAFAPAPATTSTGSTTVTQQSLDEAEALKEAKRIRELQFKNMPGEFRELRHLEKRTKSLGSEIVLDAYVPDESLKNPPDDASLEMLMASQAHMGHNTSSWNPANSRYIYGVRAGIHIISLESIASHLRRAARVVEEVAYRGGLILFVGTRRGHMPVVVRAAELAGACHLFEKWTPGTITNRDQILASAPLLMVNHQDDPLNGFVEHLQDRRPLVPDLVVCLNPLENYTLLYECGLASVPTIGIIDTDADPTCVTYQIPANDDSLRAVSLIAAVLGRAGQRGQKRRREAAAEGIVTWETPDEDQRFIDRKIYLDEKEKAEIEAARPQTRSGPAAEQATRGDFNIEQKFAEMFKNGNTGGPQGRRGPPRASRRR